MSTDDPTDELRAIELLNRVQYGRVATSMRAMPFVAPARHIVAADRVVLRMHRGMGYHRACSGSVVAYGADNFHSGEPDLWSVQFTGTANMVRPTRDQLELFGPGPRQVDGEPFDPVYLRLTPQFVTVHVLEYAAEPSGTGSGGTNGADGGTGSGSGCASRAGSGTASAGASGSGRRHDRHAA
ncbi:pyridoxamine 5'-phosphate oxidase family protein [Streptomyces sp. NBC_01511]|uniref:pyridoxamine 5'-phosphate oxidase family protein n=1 Tax=Streptomyces sp. NBC_01511 TaxID=2903889 RepID=UPI0038705BB1